MYVGIFILNASLLVSVGIARKPFLFISVSMWEVSEKGMKLLVILQTFAFLKSKLILQFLRHPVKGDLFLTGPCFPTKLLLIFFFVSIFTRNLTTEFFLLSLLKVYRFICVLITFCRIMILDIVWVTTRFSSNCRNSCHNFHDALFYIWIYLTWVSVFNRLQIGYSIYMFSNT